MTEVIALRPSPLATNDASRPPLVPDVLKPYMTGTNGRAILGPDGLFEDYEDDWVPRQLPSRFVPDKSSTNDIESLKHLLRGTAATLKPVSSTIEAPYPHWIIGDDKGNSWCRPCGQKKVATLKTQQPGDEFDLAGGYEQQANDGRCHCKGCGRLLDYRLTETGVRKEISRFTQHVVATATVEDIFHVVRLLEAAENSDDPAILNAASRIGIAIAKAIEATAKTLLQSIERSLKAAPPEKIVARIHSLFAHFPSREVPAAVEHAIAMDWGEDLSSFPDWAIAEACRTWRQTQKWKPTISEFLPLCRKSVRAHERLYRRTFSLLTYEPGKERHMGNSETYSDRPASNGAEYAAFVAAKRRAAG